MNEKWIGDPLGDRWATVCPRVCVRACLDGDGMVAVMKSSRCHEGTQGCALGVGVLSDVLCAPLYSL